jgi:hypothetical protein
MDFLKKHYEKLLLVVVLLGFVVTLAILPFWIGAAKQELADKEGSLLRPKVQALTNLDLSATLATLKRVSAPATIDLSDPIRLFNPMPWQKTADGKLILAAKVGPNALKVTGLTPLYLTLSLDSISVSDAGTKYVIGVEKQAAPLPGQRGKKQTYCKLNDKNDTFTLVDVKGSPDNPQLTVELNDTSERGVLTTNKAFKRIDGYLADLSYDPEKKTWKGRRKDSQPPLSFNGEDYNIVAITQSEVTLSAKSNGKKWTIKYAAP